MKKLILLFIFLLPSTFYLLPTAQASPTLELQHEQIQPGETILATIKTLGEFTSKITESQIKFHEGRKQTSLETEITLHENIHYLAIYTTKPENLTLTIENILYKEDGKLLSKTIQKNLTIKKNILVNEETNETYEQILKIRPGIIFSKTPSIKLTNPTTTTLNLTIKDQEISLQSISSQEIQISPEETFSLTKIKTYKEFLIPTILIKEENSTTEPAFPKTNETKPDLRPGKELLHLQLFVGNSTAEKIELFNFGMQNLTDFETSHETDFIKIEDLENMKGREIQNLTITLEPEIPGHFQDKINITYKLNETEHQAEIALSIFVLPKGSSEEEFEIKKESCSDLKGQVCDSGYLCNGTATFTKSFEYCCLDTCLETKGDGSESSGFGWLIGIVILAILGMGGYTLYKKSRTVKAPTSQDKMTQISKNFENKMSGNSSARTTGSLTK